MQETLYVETPSQTSTHYSRQRNLSNVIHYQQDYDRKQNAFQTHLT